jgi:hypothetical protein
VNDPVSPPPPPFRFSRESKIRIDADGNVWHEGERVEHERLACALASWVDFDDATKRYVLRNAMDWCFVTVDHTPLTVRSVVFNPHGVTITLNDGTSETLHAETLSLSPDGALYTYARNATLLARFERHAAFVLLEHAHYEGDVASITLHGVTTVIHAVASGDVLSPRPTRLDFIFSWARGQRTYDRMFQRRLLRCKPRQAVG